MIESNSSSADEENEDEQGNLTTSSLVKRQLSSYYREQHEQNEKIQKLHHQQQHLQRQQKQQQLLQLPNQHHQQQLPKHQQSPRNREPKTKDEHRKHKQQQDHHSPTDSSTNASSSKIRKHRHSQHRKSININNNENTTPSKQRKNQQLFNQHDNSTNNEDKRRQSDSSNKKQLMDESPKTMKSSKINRSFIKKDRSSPAITTSRAAKSETLGATTQQHDSADKGDQLNKPGKKQLMDKTSLDWNPRTKKSLKAKNGISPSTAIVTEHFDATTSQQESNGALIIVDENHPKTRLYIYMFLARCIAYDAFNVFKRTNVLNASPKISQTEFQKMRSDYVDYFQAGPDCVFGDVVYRLNKCFFTEFMCDKRIERIVATNGISSLILSEVYGK